MANITIQLNKAIDGYGNAGDIIVVAETPEVDGMITNGDAVLYNGPAPATPVPLNVGRVLITTAIAATLSTSAGADVVAILTAAAAVPTLPDATQLTGTGVTVKNRSGSSITPLVTGSQTIDGAAPAALADKAVLRLVSDGANWQQL